IILMSTAQPNNLEKFITLQQAAEKLGVSIETLLSWNQHNILKPTITQTDQFIIIRQLTGAAVVGIEKIVPEHHTQTTAPLPPSQIQEFTPALHGQHAVSGTTKMRRRHTSPAFILSFTALGILLAVGIFTQKGGLSLLSGKQIQTGEKVLGAQTSKLQLPGQIIAALPIQLNNTAKKDIQNEGEGVSKEQISAPSLYKAKTEKTLAITTTQTATSPSGQQPVHKPTGALAAAVTATSATYTSTSYFKDTCSTCVVDKDSPIDERGNIRGETKGDTLATIMSGIDGIVGSDSLKPTNTDATNQLLFFLIGALAVIYLTQQQFAYSRTKSQTTLEDEYRHRQALASQKILEVDQKTDGTVVLSFQGKEFKISKPELYSESDRFIEGLMELMQPNMKEIEYDMDNSKFITPLSRLVTRLGFVGIKRDLFFPRTSKNRVLFRKYLTMQDLTDMNLTIDQIVTDLQTAN